MKYLLDTCVFNWIVNGTHTLLDLPDGEYLVTHIQRKEIEKTRDGERKKALLSSFESCEPDQIPTKVLVFGISRLGQAALGNLDVYKRIYAKLCALDSNGRKHTSHQADAITGATAHAKGVGLVTADANFFQVMREFIPENHLFRWENRKVPNVKNL